MTAWDFPVVIIAAVAVALVVSGWLMRAARAERPPAFVCAVCGGKHGGVAARQWRYCPYCGAPRGATSTAELPRRRGAE